MGVCSRSFSIKYVFLTLVFMVQGPPGAQGNTGPRGFKGRKVSP